MRSPWSTIRSFTRVLGRALALSLLAGFFSCGGPQLKKPANLQSMALVPAGEFGMGREDGADDERPAHVVWLDAFYIDKTEVTNAQFKAFCDATGYLPPANPDWDPDYFHSKADYPVLQITYDQATAYCAWRHKRLPTEAEWEKAARGTDARKYPWGNDWDPKRVNAWGEPYKYTAPVGSFPEGASPYGAVDMAGNVWEWCYDWFDPKYYQHSPARNPTGPATPTPYRSARGGGWSSTLMSGDFEAANRSKNGPTEPRHHLGCRCAWSATWPQK